MSDPVTTAPSERGWGKLLIALAAFLIIPPYTPLRALLPVEDTILLIAPALAACCLVGWWAGGRLLLAVVWVAVAAWIRDHCGFDWGPITTIVPPAPTTTTVASESTSGSPTSAPR